MKPSKRLKHSLASLAKQGVPFARINELKPWKDNPRLNAAAVPSVMRSMQRFGWTSPVLIRAEDGFVEAGHTRLLAAQRLGLTRVPVVRLEHSQEDAELYALADNRTAELATWSPSIAELVKRYDDDDLVAASVGPADIEQMLARSRSITGGVDQPSPAAAEPAEPAEPASNRDTKPPDDGDVPAEGTDEGSVRDQLPEMPPEPTVALGELYELGDHRLFVGDTTKREDVATLMRGERGTVVVTDPPYAIFGSSSGIEADIADDKMVRPFFRSILNSTVDVLQRYGHFYICCDWRSWSSWWEEARGTPCRPKNCIVWDKGGGLGVNYANCHELLMFGSVVPGKTSMRSDKNKTGMRTICTATNVWRIPRVMKMEDGQRRVHNAQKPVALFERAFKNSSDAGDIVVDLFSGSGTALIAAEQLGRKCRTMEIDPRWAELSIRRWESLTGKKARKIG